MEDQLYIGLIKAVFVNLSKQNKEYCVGYIELPNGDSATQTYKFLVFKSSLVQAIKDMGPIDLKGKMLGLIGKFNQNTYQGNTEFQLMVNDIQFEISSDNYGSPNENNPTTEIQSVAQDNQNAENINSSAQNEVYIPEIPNY